MRYSDLVSIIMPTYNSAAFIEESIESILSQTHIYWELIITDDCSTDGTIEIVKKLCLNDRRIVLYELDKNSGSGAARNNSINLSNGNLLAFCDSDDLWDRRKLERHIEFHKDNDAVLSYTNIKIIDENGLTLLKRQTFILCRSFYCYNQEKIIRVEKYINLKLTFDNLN